MAVTIEEFVATAEGKAPRVNIEQTPLAFSRLTVRPDEGIAMFLEGNDTLAALGMPGNIINLVRDKGTLFTFNVTISNVSFRSWIAGGSLFPEDPALEATYYDVDGKQMASLTFPATSEDRVEDVSSPVGVKGIRSVRIISNGYEHCVNHFVQTI